MLQSSYQELASSDFISADSRMTASFSGTEDTDNYDDRTGRGAGMAINKC